MASARAPLTRRVRRRYAACESVQFPATGQSVLHTFGWDKGYAYFLSAQGMVLPSGYSPFQIDFAFDAGGLDVPAAACDDARGGWACAASDCPAAGGGDGECPVPAAAARGGAAGRGAKAAADVAGALCAAAALAWALLSARDATADAAEQKAADDAAAAAAADGAAEAAAEAAEEEHAGEPRYAADDAHGLLAPLLPPAPAHAAGADGDASAPHAGAPSAFWHAVGAAVGRRPRAVLAASALLALCGAAAAVALLRLETDPAALWVPPRSRGAAEAAASAASFGRFYRVAQLIATPVDAAQPALSAAAVTQLLALQARVAALRAPLPGAAGDDADANDTATVSLGDVCFRADASIAGDVGCLVQSATNWFGDDVARIAAPPELAPGVPSTFDTWLRGDGPGGVWPGCLADAAHPRCLSPAGLPAFPHVVLGGYDAAGGADPARARALVVTWLLRSDDDTIPAAAAWEAAFLEELAASAADASSSLAFAYSAERSVGDELRRETGMDGAAVGAAYLAMFAYVAATLAPRGTRLAPRVALAAGGLACVGAALACAAGAAAAAGVRASLIAAEVVPFLVLACGVDNMFVLADAWQRAKCPPAGATPAHTGTLRAAAAAADVGRAVTAAAAAEVAALALGAALAAMPAVRGFAIFSCLAIAFDYIFQMGTFLAMLVLLGGGASDSGGAAARDADGHEADGVLSGGSPPGEVAAAVNGNDEPAGAAVAATAAPPPRRWSAAAYAAWLLRPRVAAAALALAGIAAGASLALLPRMPLGLDQSTALPPDSYLGPYFAAVAAYLQVGPPVYWVLAEPLLYWDIATQNTLTSLPCAFATEADGSGNASVPGVCGASLAQRLGACGRGGAGAAARLVGQPSDWLGDYLRWLDPSAALCRVADAAAPPPARGDAVPAPCAAQGAAAADAAGCGVCAAVRSGPGAPWAPAPGAWQPLAAAGVGSGGPPRPTRATFEAHLPLFLASRCSAALQVSLCGTPYTSALDARYTAWAAAALAAAPAPPPAPAPGVAASRLAGFHAPLRTQADFIAARGAAGALADALGAELGVALYPYSPFYIFFEQYGGLRSRAAATLAAAVAAAALAAGAALRSARGAAAVAAAVGGTALCLGGACAAGGISLNALSLANLSAAAGIATEFCIHIAARACAAGAAGAAPPAAAAAGLRAAGGVVARGVVATKAIGVACLGLARTRVFRTYYFAMYGALVALAAAHALVALPALLAARAPRCCRRRGARAPVPA